MRKPRGKPHGFSDKSLKQELSAYNKARTGRLHGMTLSDVSRTWGGSVRG